MLLLNRSDAGRQLAARLTQFAGRDDVLMLALPRGVTPRAEVAAALGVRLDVFLLRKLGVPGQEELAMGAIASGGVRVLNDDVVRAVRPSAAALDRVAAAEGRELERREQEYRGGRPPLEVREKTVIVVDDGLATGSTMRVAVPALRRLGPVRVVVAVPVVACDTCGPPEEADEVVCVHTPVPFYAVGPRYDDSSQTSDAEVRELFGRGKPHTPANPHPSRTFPTR